MVKTKIGDWLWWWQDEHGWVDIAWYTDFVTKETTPIKKRPRWWNLYGHYVVMRYIYDPKT